jgi:AraC-like DNA-binding protein
MSSVSRLRRVRRVIPEPRDWTYPPLPRRHGMLAAIMCHTFGELGVNAALWIRDAWWHPLHRARDVTDFERELGADQRRWAYNDRCFRQAIREKRAVVGEHAGFHDVFVPVIDQEGLHGILVAGPFATERPSSAEVRKRWLAIGGSPAPPGDPSFAAYLRATLSTLTLEGPLRQAFVTLLECLTALMLGKGTPEALAAQTMPLRQRLGAARLCERMWNATHRLVSEETRRNWIALQHSELAAFGIPEVPRHVLVGLLVSARADADPFDAEVRNDAFQRAAVALVRKHGRALAGPAGDRGVVVLLDHPGSAAAARAQMLDLGARAATTAGRHGFRLHLGVAPAADSSPVSSRYDGAVRAAEQALTRGVAVAHAEPHPERSAGALRELRSELARSPGRDAKLLVPRFDRYAEAVMAHAGHDSHFARTALQAGLERLIDALAATAFLEERTARELLTAMDRETEDASSPAQIVLACRRLVTEVVAAIGRATAARQDRSVARARAFIDAHLGDSLMLEQVARVAGFAPDYFSRLFKHEEGTTFVRYVKDARIRRAQQMLYETKLTLAQIQKLCGFQTRGHFQRAFKATVGKTPSRYREVGPA